MTLEEAQVECELALRYLEKCFQPHCRLTLLMRNPNSHDGDLIMTRDDLAAVEASIRRFREREDVCEHGVQTGDFCEWCNAEYKRAALDPDNA